MSISGAIKKFLMEQKVKSVLKNSKIGATTDLVLFNIRRNSGSLSKYDDLRIDFIKSSNHLRGAVGERFISIIANEQYFGYIQGLFEGEIESVQKKVACIVIDCSGTDNVSGFITYLASILANKKINMHGFFTSYDDITLIIDEEKAFEYVEYIKKVLKA